MKLDEALDVVAGNIDKGYSTIEKMLYDAFIKHHGLEDLHFFGDHSWFYCSDIKPPSHIMYKYTSTVRDKLYRLSALASGNGLVIYWGDGNHRFRTIDEVKRHHFTKKLAGLSE